MHENVCIYMSVCACMHACMQVSFSRTISGFLLMKGDRSMGMRVFACLCVHATPMLLVIRASNHIMKNRVSAWCMYAYVVHACNDKECYCCLVCVCVCVCTGISR